MEIQFSYKNAPLELHALEDVTSYTQTDNECVIFTAEGLLLVLRECDIEDFSVIGLGQ